MKLRIPQFRTRVALLAIITSMVMVGAAISSYGASIAHDFPKLILGHPMFPVALLLFGVFGIILYLFKALFSSRIPTMGFRLFLVIPLILYAAFFLMTGSPSVMAWSLSTALFGTYAIVSTERGTRNDAVSILGPYAFSFLILFGFFNFFIKQPFEYLPLGFVAILGVIVGVIGIFAMRQRYESLHVVMKMLSGVTLLAMVAIFVFLGQSLIHAILVTPLGLALLLEPVLKKIKFREPPSPKMKPETLRILQFQDVTEVNAWVIFTFAFVHIFISSEFIGSIFFFLFGLAFVMWVYQYHFKSIEVETYRGYFINSFKNLVLLSVVAHFVGGFYSSFSWFYPIVILSSVVTSKKSHVYSKLGYMSIVLLIEAALAYHRGEASLAGISESLLLYYFVLIVTALYIHRVASIQKKIDEGLESVNRSLSKALAGEQEAKAVISAQALELRQAQEQIERIMGSVADGIVAVDSEGGVVFMNEAAMSMLAPTGTIIKSDNFSEILPFKNENPNVPGIDMIVRGILSEEVSEDVESYGISSDDDERIFLLLPEGMYLELESGKRVYLEGAIVDLGEGTGNVRIVITFRNITYRREIDQMKTDFMSVAAHQLRTPLSSIRWFLELLNDPSEGRLKKNQKMFAENAYTSLIRMINLVNGLLAVTRVESSRVPSKPERTMIPEMTKGVLEELAQDIKEKKLVVHVKSGKDIPAVNLDPQLSREVFKNLISNAVRYSTEKGDVLISITDEEKEIHWSISDSGIGIPKDQQSRIFEKFYRASNAASHEAQGTGLGLYLAKFIVTQWGGKIWFSSKEGEGTMFHVTVPHAGMKERKGEVSLHA